MQLSELDLFKISEKSPIYLQSVESISKTLYKVWSGLTKFTKSALLKNQSPTSKEFGKFLPTSPIKFIPSVSFLSYLKVHFKGTSDNTQSVQEKPTSYTSISEVCQIDRETVILCLKEILSQVSRHLSTGFSVSLNFKIGEIKLSKGFSEFIPAESAQVSERSQSLGVSTPRSSRYTVISSTPSVHPSNPNPLHQGVSSNINNYYRGLSFNKNNTQLSPIAFYTGQIHPALNFRSRYSRKQAFDQPIQPAELLKYHQDQIRNKSEKTQKEKKLETNEFIKAQLALKESLKKERENRITSEYNKWKEYEKANLDQAQVKLTHRSLEKERNKNETYDFFPFVHGDEVEARTKNLNAELKEELKNYLKTVGSSPVKSDAGPVVAVPKFLQTAEYTSFRRSQNFHVEEVMKRALETYHKDIKNLEKAKEKERREIDERKASDLIYYKHLEDTRRKELSENFKELNNQIKENVLKKAKEVENSKKLRMTGLEMSLNQYDDLENKRKVYRENRDFLVDQMEFKDSKYKNEAKREREIDIKTINNVENNIAKEDHENIVNENYSKTLNRDVWLKQMEIKSIEKDVGKVL